jgi:hypothetical protein
LRRWANRDWKGDVVGRRLPSTTAKIIPKATRATKSTERPEETSIESGGEETWSAVENKESTSPRMKRRTGMTSSWGRDSMAGPSNFSADFHRVLMSVNRSTAL